MVRLQIQDIQILKTGHRIVIITPVSCLLLIGTMLCFSVASCMNLTWSYTIDRLSRNQLNVDLGICYMYADAAKVIGVVITSSPSPTPAAIAAI